MTQSDAPNEGKRREERQRIEEAQNQAAKEWNEAFDYRALRNGVQCGNILMLHLDRVNIRAMEIYTESLRDQLSKEREKVGELENEVKRLEGLLVEDEEIMTSDSEELQKERKMRKELVDTLKEIYEYITDEGILEDLAGVEELIERASELDKK